jgi:hypothetical protein
VLVAVTSMLAVREGARDSFIKGSRAVADEKLQAAAQQPVAAPAPVATTPAVMPPNSSTVAAPRDLAKDRRESAATPKNIVANERSLKREASVLEKQTANVGGAGAAQAREAPPSVSAPAAPTPVPAPVTGRVAGGVAADAATSIARGRRAIADTTPARRADSVTSALRVVDSLSFRSDQRIRESNRVNEVAAASPQSRFAAQAKTAVGSASAAGCYSFGSELPPWASTVPRRFALDASALADSTPEIRIVRAVNGTIIDAPIRLASWRMAPDSVGVARAVVTWPTGSNAIFITIEPGMFPPRLATISDVAHSQAIPLARIACSSR